MTQKIYFLPQGLAKKLRSCGVDAEALENEESWDRCYRYYERERRTVLTRGNNYHKLTKYIPVQFVYSVQSEVIFSCSFSYILRARSVIATTHMQQQGRNVSLQLFSFIAVIIL